MSETYKKYIKIYVKSKNLAPRIRDTIYFATHASETISTGDWHNLEPRSCMFCLDDNIFQNHKNVLEDI